MRIGCRIAAFLAIVAVALPLRPAAPDDPTIDEQRIEALEVRAAQAEPRDQCFLYAQVVQQMTELSIRQYAAGDVTRANSLLQHIQRIAQKIHFGMGDNDKRLKNAELLLSHTAFRLTEMLQASSMENRPLVQQTLVQVTDAKDAAMMQVFKK